MDIMDVDDEDDDPHIHDRTRVWQAFQGPAHRLAQEDPFAPDPQPEQSVDPVFSGPASSTGPVFSGPSSGGQIAVSPEEVMLTMISYLTMAGSWIASLSDSGDHRLFLTECDSLVYEATCLVSDLEARSTSDLNRKHKLKSSWCSWKIKDLQQKYQIIMDGGRPTAFILSPKTKQQEAMMETGPTTTELEVDEEQHEEPPEEIDEGLVDTWAAGSTYEDVDPESFWCDAKEKGKRKKGGEANTESNDSESESDKPLAKAKPSAKKARTEPKARAKPKVASTTSKGKAKGKAKSKKGSRVRAD